MKDKQIKQTIHYALVVDESGSMSSYRTDTIGGFNEQVKVAKELQEQYKDQNYLFTLCTFEGSNEIKQRIFQQPIAETVELTTDNYSPRGSTALFQAVGETILKLQPKVKQGDKVIFTIITDGEENSSSPEWQDGSKVRGLVEELKATNDWIFNFLSGDLSRNANVYAKKMGVENAQNYSTVSTKVMYKTRGGDLKRFAHAVSNGLDFAPENYLSTDESTVEVK
jgi:hypothetical protein